MIETLIVWVFLFINAFVLGYEIQEIYAKLIKNYKIDYDISWIVGIAVLTVYAQIFSIFFPVGINAFIIVNGISILLIIKNRKVFLVMYKKIYSFSLEEYIFVFIIGLVILYFTSISPDFYDTYLYHAQAVHWIEDYGCVKGIANVNSRIGFNSSAFSLYALFSMKYFFAKSMHSVNGFCALCGMFFAIRKILHFGKLEYRFSHMMCGVLLLYIGIAGPFTPYSYLSSLSPDYIANIIVGIIIIKYIEYVEKGSFDLINKIELFSLILIWVSTIKISMIFFVLISVIPLYEKFIRRKWRNIIFWIASGIVIWLPFLFRNIIISGYIIYPVSQLNWFDVTWKVKEEIVKAEANSIYSWARCPKASLDSTIGVGVAEWFPLWWNYYGFQTKMLFVGGILSIFLFIVITCLFYKNNMMWNCYLILGVTLVANALYWFFSAPDIRFCYVPLCELIMYGLYMVLFNLPTNYMMPLVNKIKKNEWINGKNILIFFALFIYVWNFLILPKLTNEMNLPDLKSIIVHAGDYNSKDVEFDETLGVKLYYPREMNDDQTGYYAFPGMVSSSVLEQIKLIGNDYKDGFMAKE